MSARFSIHIDWFTWWFVHSIVICELFCFFRFVRSVVMLTWMQKCLIWGNDQDTQVYIINGCNLWNEAIPHWNSQIPCGLPKQMSTVSFLYISLHLAIIDHFLFYWFVCFIRKLYFVVCADVHMTAPHLNTHESHTFFRTSLHGQFPWPLLFPIIIIKHDWILINDFCVWDWKWSFPFVLLLSFSICANHIWLNLVVKAVCSI